MFDQLDEIKGAGQRELDTPQALPPTMAERRAQYQRSLEIGAGASNGH